MAETTLRGMGNFIRLLPTGTTFVFQFLNPVLTNSGECSATNKVLTGILMGLCGFACAFSCFTDSYKDSKGKRQYVIVTPKGCWPATDEDPIPNAARYRLKLGDFARAILNVIVFGVVALLDGNTVSCLYPSFREHQKALLMAFPPVIGFLSSSVFSMFPTMRAGIGYPPSEEDSSEDEP